MHKSMEIVVRDGRRYGYGWISGNANADGSAFGRTESSAPTERGGSGRINPLPAEPEDVELITAMNQERSRRRSAERVAAKIRQRALRRAAVERLLKRIGAGAILTAAVFALCWALAGEVQALLAALPLVLVGWRVRE